MSPHDPEPVSTLDVIDAAGEARRLGHLASTPTKAALFEPWATSNPVLPESSWREFDIWPAEVKIKDQDGKGACNPHAATLGLELLRWLQGASFVELSPWLVYADLCGGWDQGSSIADALKYLEAKGTCPFDAVPYATINPKRVPAAARESAARFKVEAGAMLGSPEELMSAVQLLRPVNFSVCVGSRFNTLDAEGVPGLGTGTDNHAVTAAFGAKRSAKWGWCVKMANSWTTQWGWKGFCWVPLKALFRNYAFEAYAISAASADPLDKNYVPWVPPHPGAL